MSVLESAPKSAAPIKMRECLGKHYLLTSLGNRQAPVLLQLAPEKQRIGIHLG